MIITKYTKYTIHRWRRR